MWLALLALLGCRNGDECDNADRISVFVDEDGDGWGTDEPAGKVCEVKKGQAEEKGDCDDENPDVHPDAEEQCNGLDDDCDDSLDEGLDGTRPFYGDSDNDGFGNPNSAVVACAAPPGFVSNDTDCDDGVYEINPGATEVCNGIDDDCNDLADEADPDVDIGSFLSWYPDADLDGYGRPGEALMACVGPKGSVDNDLDCEDGDPYVNPDGTEVCNGVDDDCDGDLDDQDSSIDVAELSEFFVDSDGDGAGTPLATVLLCGPRPGFGVQNDGDCDDYDPYVSPAAPEVLCDSIDNDCDPASPDDRDADGDKFTACVDDCNDQDPTVNPAATEVPADGTDSDCDGYENCYQDVDGDGSRTAVAVPVADPTCTVAPSVPPVRPIDCDDNDPAYSWTGEWVTDADDDGFGDGVVALSQCPDPGTGYVLEGGEIDCDDNATGTYPGAPDTCNDGLDADCDLLDSCASCQAWLDSDGGLGDGVYGVRPDGDAELQVYCDMSLDGGGWTLVASTFGQTLNDAVGPHHGDLASLNPVAPHAGVWGGLGPAVLGNADVRFACKTLVSDTAMAVDMTFYDVDWYTEITSGNDAASCFAESGNPPLAPARRDNLTATTLALGDDWDNGGLVGEDTCGDSDDFTVDFDDRGMDGDEGDGTDWGEDDGKPKCGESNAGEAWFLFVREL